MSSLAAATATSEARRSDTVLKRRESPAEFTPRRGLCRFCVVQQQGNNRGGWPVEQQELDRVWRVWVDEQNRVVSFRETADSRMMEFASREEFLRRVDEFTARNYRYR